MNLATLPIEAIDAVALESLKTAAVPEGRLIEFKSALPGRTDGEKIEFLADVSSFANASGGHLVYGVVEEGGVATEIRGLPGIDPDAEILRLEAMIRDGIDPRMPGVACRAVRVQNGENVVVIRVPNSWVAPHMIVFKQHSRFYSRNSAGKYALDVTELRSAFALSESVGQRIREFRDFRVGKIIARDTPVLIEGDAAFILHLIPISAFAREHSRDLVAEGATARGLETPEGGFDDWWYNFDGILASASPNEKAEVAGYTQLYRDGRVEMVGIIDDEARDRKMLRGIYLEQVLIALTKSALAYLLSNRIEPPIVVSLALIGIKGFQMARSEVFPRRRHGVDRDVLPIPEVLFQGEQQRIGALLRPCFNAVWNACGFEASPNYTEAGEWTPERR